MLDTPEISAGQVSCSVLYPFFYSRFFPCKCCLLLFYYLNEVVVVVCCFYNARGGLDSHHYFFFLIERYCESTGRDGRFLIRQRQCTRCGECCEEPGVCNWQCSRSFNRLLPEGCQWNLCGGPGECFSSYPLMVLMIQQFWIDWLTNYTNLLFRFLTLLTLY